MSDTVRKCYEVRTDVLDDPPWTHLSVHEIPSAETLSRFERIAVQVGEHPEAIAGPRSFGDKARWLYRPIHHATAV